MQDYIVFDKVVIPRLLLPLSTFRDLNVKKYFTFICFSNYLGLTLVIGTLEFCTSGLIKTILKLLQVHKSVNVVQAWQLFVIHC